MGLNDNTLLSLTVSTESPTSRSDIFLRLPFSKTTKLDPVKQPFLDGLFAPVDQKIETIMKFKNNNVRRY